MYIDIHIHMFKIYTSNKLDIHFFLLTLQDSRVHGKLSVQTFPSTNLEQKTLNPNSNLQTSKRTAGGNGLNGLTAYLAPFRRFIEGSSRLKGHAKALDVWRLETKIEVHKG